ncbi:MAG: hypothetical protein FWG53_03865 [Clostridiales bacterium]|nr:hypothetical protein [Clostridiales bacterium]
MKTRKLLLVLLAVLLLFSFNAFSWADDDPVEGESTDVTTDVTDEEGVEPIDADLEDGGDQVVFEIPVPGKVVVSNQPLTIDGELVEAEAYNIDGANYFKLRDMAALITGTDSQFNVTYEAPNIVVTIGEEYEPIEGDLAKGEDKSASCVPSKQVLVVDGNKVDILVYNIGGNNYFQLRGLGDLIGFGVEYDDATRTIFVDTVIAEAEDEGEPDDEGGDDGDEPEA